MTKKPKVIEIALDDNAATTSLSPKGMRGRLADVENQTKAIYWVGIIALIAIVATCSALVLDQMHFNNQTYREQSQINELRYKELSEKVEMLEKK